jgi:hypothetical protein
MRVPFRFTLSIGVAVVMLCVAIAHTAFAAATRPAPVPMQQYNVLFSRDDKLCTTLRDFYNRHLRDRDSETEGYLEDQFGSDLQRSGIEFLHESKDWKPYGSDGFPWVQVLPKLDIYNDNGSRTVVLLDRGNLKFVAFRSQILILKPDVDTAEITQITNLLDFRGDARIEQWIDFTFGGSSLTPPATVYRVPEIPASGKRIRPGAIGAAAQRPLRFQNKTYVIARTRLEHFAITMTRILHDECSLNTRLA